MLMSLLALLFLFFLAGCSCPIEGGLTGRFRRYNFCLRLLHAISRAHAARVMEKVAHNSRHSTLPVPTIVVGF